MWVPRSNRAAWEVLREGWKLDAGLIAVKYALMGEPPLFAHPRERRLARITTNHGHDGGQRGTAEQWLEEAR